MCELDFREFRRVLRLQVARVVVACTRNVCES
jgi:hypothetical protein